MTLRVLLIALAIYSHGLLGAPLNGVPRSIRVVMDNSYAPYSFKDDRGKVQGILVDQWREWERQTGVKVEIQAMNWEEAQRQMRAGEFDVIDSIVEVPEREAYLDFTPAYAWTQASIYFRNDIPGIADLSSLRGFPVAVKAGDQHIARLRESGVNTVVTFASDDEVIRAARHRKVNVFLMDDPSAHNLLNRHGIADQFQHSPPVFRDGLRRAVRKGDSGRLRQVIEGFALVKPAVLSRIEQKWFGRDVGASNQYLKYIRPAVWIALAVILGLAVWNRSLHNGILQRTSTLAESELRLRQIMENIRDVFWMSTPAPGKLLYLSPSYEAIWGRPVEDMYRDPQISFNAIHPDGRDEVIAAFMGPAELGFDVEYRIIRPDGTMRWIRNRAFPVKDASGKIYRIAGICQDLTEQKLAEAASREAASHLEALSRRLVSLQEFERKELARELHDQVGQSLTALNINLSILSAALLADATEDVRGRLADSEALVEATTAAIRNVVTELRPPMLDDQGVVFALDWYALQVSARTGVSVVVRGSRSSDRPTNEREIALFRIAQEALNNVVKHARARRVEITLGRAGTEYVMAVEDDGIGLDPADERQAQHWGLGIVTMRERSLAVGGRFEVRALPGRGTRLTVWVPAG